MFELGQILQSKGIAAERAESDQFKNEVYTALKKYRSMDWGETSKKDKTFNDEAVKESNSAIFARYETSKGYIIFVTDQDRTQTKIYLYEEY